MAQGARNTDLQHRRIRNFSGLEVAEGIEDSVVEDEKQVSRLRKINRERAILLRPK
jgi:hypothetical protein